MLKVVSIFHCDGCDDGCDDDDDDGAGDDDGGADDDVCNEMMMFGHDTQKGPLTWVLGWVGLRAMDNLLRACSESTVLRPWPALKVAYT